MFSLKLQTLLAPNPKCFTADVFSSFVMVVFNSLPVEDKYVYNFLTIQTTKLFKTT